MKQKPHNTLTASIITPVSRKEDEYFRSAALSVAELRSCLPYWTIDWLIAPDGIEDAWIVETLEGLDVGFNIISQDQEPSQRGAAFPRNRALKHTNSYWTLCLDEDDELIPENMAALLSQVVATNSEWGAGRMYDIDQHGRVIRRGPKIQLGKHIPLHGISRFKEKHGYYPFECCATVAQTSLIKRVGGWAEAPKLKKCEDMAMWFAINYAHKGLWLDLPVHKYRNNPDSVTHQKTWGQGLRDLELLTDYAVEISKNKLLFN